MEKKVVEAILEIPGLLSQIYSDIAQPGVRKVGQALETVLDSSNTILLPLKLLNERSKILFTYNMDRYRRKLESKKDKEIVEVPLEIGLPILDRLTYTKSEEISELFINLLASASSCETIHSSHPGFITVIESISVDEARIIQYLSKLKSDRFPVLNLNLIPNDGRGFSEVAKMLTGIEYEIDLLYPENMKLYFDNLIRLGIIKYDSEHYVGDEKCYNSLMKRYQDSISRAQLSVKVGLWARLEEHKASMEITDYGLEFIKACINQPK